MVTFGNANQTTKNDLLAQYLVSKDLDPILLREHRPLCQKELIIMDSTISLQNKTLDTKLKTILSLCHDILGHLEHLGHHRHLDHT